MDVHDPNGLELWRERRAGLQREAESHRLSRRSRAAPSGRVPAKTTTKIQGGDLNEEIQMVKPC